MILMLGGLPETKWALRHDLPPEEALGTIENRECGRLDPSSKRADLPLVGVRPAGKDARSPRIWVVDMGRRGVAYLHLGRIIESLGGRLVGAIGEGEKRRLPADAFGKPLNERTK